MFTTKRRAVAIAIAAALAAATLVACGSPAAVSANKVSLPKVARKIVSLSPTATESLFAMGAGRQVIAADSLSNYPILAPRTELSAFNLSVEAVAKYKPDLVILSFDTTSAKNALAAFAKLKIPVLLQPAATTLSDVYEQITELGKVTGRTETATSIVDEMKKQIATIVKSTNPGAGIKVFHELDSTLYTATSETFIGHIYKDFGLTNIADAAGTADENGYPQLTSEYIVKANPGLIYLTDTNYGESEFSVAKRPGWNKIEAVQARRIVSLNPDISSRWGPRVVEIYREIAGAIPASM